MPKKSTSNIHVKFNYRDRRTITIFREDLEEIIKRAVSVETGLDLENYKIRFEDAMLYGANVHSVDLTHEEDIKNND